MDNREEAPGRAVQLCIAACFAALGIQVDLALVVGVVFCALGLIALLVRRWRFLRPFLLGLPIFLLLFTVRNAQTRSSLEGLVKPAGAHLTCRVQIIGDPIHQTNRYTGDNELRLCARLLEHRLTPDWRAGTGRIVVRCADAHLPVQPGEVWEFTGQLRERQIAFPGLLPSTHELRVGSDMANRLVEASPYFPDFWRNHLSNQVALLCGSDNDTAQILQSLLIGMRSNVDAALMEKFARTGVLHVFAISGLHIGILAGACIFICRICGITKRHWAWWVLPVLIAFVAVSGWKASSVRALIMVALWLLAPAIYRKASPFPSLAAAAVLILCISPGQIAAPGFQFSFILMLGIHLSVPRITLQLEKLSRADPWAPATRGKRAFRQRILLPVAASIVVSAVAFVWSAPLTAHYFNLFTPVSLISNLWVVPWAGLTLCIGLPLLILSLLLPATLAIPFFAPVVLLGRVFVWGVDSTLNLGWGSWWVPPPSVWWTALFYAGMLCILVCSAFRRRFVLGFAAFVIASLVWAYQDIHRVRWVIRDAGAGQCSWIQKGGRAVLVDTGPAWQAEFLVRSLRASGVNSVDALILTHADARHIGGTPTVLAAYPHTIVRVRDAQTLRSFEDPIQATPHPLPWSTRLWDSGQLTLVPAPSENSSTEDNRSLIVHFGQRAASLLICGGLDERGEEAWIADSRLPALSARWILAGNAASRPGCSDSFRSSLQPELLVISGSRNSRSGQRTAERATAAGISVLRVQDKQQLRIDLLRERYSAQSL